MLENPTRLDLERMALALHVAGAEALSAYRPRLPAWAWHNIAKAVHDAWDERPELLPAGIQRQRFLDPILPKHWTINLRRLQHAGWAALVFACENYWRNHRGEDVEFWKVERPVLSSRAIAPSPSRSPCSPGALPPDTGGVQ